MFNLISYLIKDFLAERTFKQATIYNLHCSHSLLWLSHNDWGTISLKIIYIINILDSLGFILVLWSLYDSISFDYKNDACSSFIFNLKIKFPEQNNMAALFQQQHFFRAKIDPKFWSVRKFLKVVLATFFCLPLLFFNVEHLSHYVIICCMSFIVVVCDPQ